MGNFIQDPPRDQPTAMIPGTILPTRQPARDREPARIAGIADPKSVATTRA